MRRKQTSACNGCDMGCDITRRESVPTSTTRRSGLSQACCYQLWSGAMFYWILRIPVSQETDERCEALQQSSSVLVR